MQRKIVIAFASTLAVTAGLLAAPRAEAQPSSYYYRQGYAYRHGPAYRHTYRHARVSGCLARQRAMLAPLDRYGGYLPGNAPGLMREIVNPMLDVIRTRCLPAYNGPPQDAGYDSNSPTIASPPSTPSYVPSANNPACPGSVC